MIREGQVIEGLKETDVHKRLLGSLSYLVAKKVSIRLILNVNADLLTCFTANSCCFRLYDIFMILSARYLFI